MGDGRGEVRGGGREGIDEEKRSKRGVSEVAKKAWQGWIVGVYLRLDLTLYLIVCRSDHPSILKFQHMLARKVRGDIEELKRCHNFFYHTTIM